MYLVRRSTTPSGVVVNFLTPRQCTSCLQQGRLPMAYLKPQYDMKET
jgi:hypothetical protein